MRSRGSGAVVGRAKKTSRLAFIACTLVLAASGCASGPYDGEGADEEQAARYDAEAEAFVAEAEAQMEEHLNAEADKAVDQMPCQDAIPWSKASAKVGRFASIKGPVVSVRDDPNANGSPIFVNIGGDYPNQRFTAVIWGEDLDGFSEDPASYSGEIVCVMGEVRNYNGIPQMDLMDDSMIAVFLG